jgi:hypothetical protein
MGVIDVVGVEQCVEWRVDRWRRSTDAEAARVVEGDEIVFVDT